jgi:lipoteichoic acid synthase
MPNLTRLAQRAVVFDRMYGVYPESIKGLFTTLCSRPPAYGTEPEIYADVPCDAMPQVFKNHGYRTALFHSGRFDYLGMRSIIDHRGFDLLEDAGAIGGHTDSSFGIDETSAVDHILGWIDHLEPADHFFATYLPIAGHHPYATTAPGPFRGNTEFTQYLNALHEADAALGRLLDGLRARHLDRDTVVVIYGDHGEGFDQHDGNRGHTLFVYDENIHVPFLFALPGWGDASPAASAPIHIDHVASLLDLAPTVLDLAGLPRQPRHEGVSLLNQQPRMALFFTDYSLGWLGLVDGCWTYRLQVEANSSTLYDSCQDPAERRDRSLEHADLVTNYRDRLTSWIQHERRNLQRTFMHVPSPTR